MTGNKALISKSSGSPEGDFVLFKVESALLRELGEQLVGSVDIAISELIKNSYDADASKCEISWDNKKLIVADNGHGMTFDEFDKYWMTIGTSSKLKKKKSKTYERDLTGSKGVGRFAVRFLGRKLTLESISYDEKTGRLEKITATFNWDKIDVDENIDHVKIPYTREVLTKGKTGTILTIENLSNANKPSKDKLKETKENVIAMTSPFEVFKSILPEDYQSNDSDQSKGEDPGFSVYFTDDESDVDIDEVNLATEVLTFFLARAIIKPENGKYRITIEHKEKNEIVYDQVHEFGSHLSNEVYADVRFFPWRKGVFASKKIKAKQAKDFIRNNHGVKIYDRLFRIKPYGIGDNDWLKLTEDSVRSRRKPRSVLGNKYLSMDEETERKPLLNWMLNLPTNFQLTGAVFVQSNSDPNVKGLIPSMDRQGFMENEAYFELFEIVRFAIELIAKIDKDFIIENNERERAEKLEKTRGEIKETIQIINSSVGLTDEDKLRLIESYESIHDSITSVEEYDRQARESIDVMSMLGVVAGFMTHEYQSSLTTLQEVSELLKELSKQDSNFVTHKDSIDKSIDYFNDYIQYSQAYIYRTSNPKYESWKVLPRVRYVTNTFKGFCTDRGIEVDYSDIAEDLISPKISLVMYHGILHNLYTNSVKALASHTGGDKKIKINVFEKDAMHIITVMDNGPGIPDLMKDRIWDPLYTTTSSENNPLGSGMGLGLSLVKKVVEAMKGKIELVIPSAGFNTAFEVRLPNKK